MRQHYKSLDMMKLIFAFAVLTVHNCNYELNGYRSWFYLEHLVLRMSVPFFFLTSGFLLGEKVKANPGRKTEYMKKNVKTLLEHYLFWGSIYTIVTIGFNLKHGIEWGTIIFVAVRDLLTFNPLLMWYIGSLVFSIVVIGLIREKRTFQVSLVVGALLYCVGMLMGSYSGIFTGTIIEDALRVYYKYFVNSSNGLFVGYIFVGLGYYIGRYWEKKVSKGLAILQILLGYGIMLGEIVIIGYLPRCLEGNYDFLLGTLVVSPALFLLILQWEIPEGISTAFFRRASACIYFSHMLVISVVKLLFDLPLGIEYVLVIVIELIGAYIIYKWDNKWINRIT